MSAYVVSTHVALWQPKEFVAFGARLHNFFEGEVHVRVAVHKMAVECFAVFKLDEHRVALRRVQKAQRELEKY